MHGGIVANHGLSPTAPREAEGGRDGTVHKQALETIRVLTPSKSVSQVHRAVDGHLQDRCEMSHLVLNLASHRKLLRYPLKGGKEALVSTHLRDCG